MKTYNVDVVICPIGDIHSIFLVFRLNYVTICKPCTRCEPLVGIKTHDSVSCGPRSRRATP